MQLAEARRGGPSHVALQHGQLGLAEIDDDQAIQNI